MSVRNDVAITLILRQELIMVNETDAALHSPDDDYGLIRVVSHITECLADGEHLYLTDRPLLSNSDAGGDGNGNDPEIDVRIRELSVLSRALLGDSVPKPLGFIAFAPE